MCKVAPVNFREVRRHDDGLPCGGRVVCPDHDGIEHDDLQLVKRPDCSGLHSTAPLRIRHRDNTQGGSYELR